MQPVIFCVTLPALIAVQTKDMESNRRSSSKYYLEGDTQPHQLNSV